jgi:hypothetical protein
MEGHLPGLQGRMSDSLTILGIRHHGPGSARSVVAALESLQPDAILVEGPPDAEEILPLAGLQEMRPPVAILIYIPDQPRRAVYYPFAEFSPEWQAIRYGIAHNIPVQFMDLPQKNQFATPEPEQPIELASPDESASPEGAGIRQDPLAWAARAAGYSDGERWWEHMIEQRRDSREVFKAVLELMTALRSEAATESAGEAHPVDGLREAHMRKTIRTAQKQYAKIAVVCGAWHAPVLAGMPKEKEDAAALKNLPSVKVSATWVPWSNGRLTYRSGYGAGIQSPGYYHHLWNHADEVASRWMIRVAGLLREQDLDASVASVIESVRLAESLTAIRDRRLPGLTELNEAACAVLCSGDEIKMALIAERLVVGGELGEVPESTPTVPLQRDLQQLQKRLRLKPEAVRRTVDLDLRKETELERSHLLHRLNLLGIPWGKKGNAGGKGTFHEIWSLEWQPEFSVLVIEASIWGNTVENAATARTIDVAGKRDELSALTGLVEDVLLADLSDAVTEVMTRLQNVAALTTDVPLLMDALGPLAEVLRYGNVRKTDTEMVAHVVDGLTARICIGLPAACGALNDDAAELMFGRVTAVSNAVLVLQKEDLQAEWRLVLEHLSNMSGLHGLIAGRCCRILFDQSFISADEAGRLLNLALSLATDPAQAAAWIDGFLRGSGQVLLHNEDLWSILDGWVASLSEDWFVPLLPLLRRTFSTFPSGERRQMGQHARTGESKRTRRPAAASDLAVDVVRADRVIPVIAQILGVNIQGTNTQTEVSE